MPKAIPFHFTDDLWNLAMREAERRQSLNERRGNRPRNGAPATGDEALAAHKKGAIGEVAVGVFLGRLELVFTEEYARRNTDDLRGLGIDVKTCGRHHYNLPVQLDDHRPTCIYVLVTIELPNRMALLHGWARGAQITLKQYEDDPARNG